MSEMTDSMDCKDRIREALLQLQRDLVAGRFCKVVSDCSTSRLQAEVIRHTIEQYGHRLRMPENDTTTNIEFCCELSDREHPTWAVYVHLLDEDGFNDLTVEVAAICINNNCHIELDDIRVL